MGFLLKIQNPAYAQTSFIDIKGVSIDTTIKFISIVDYPPVWQYDVLSIIPLSRQNVLKNKFQLKFKSDKSGELTMMLLGANIYIYTTPGDKISFIMDRVNNKTRVVFAGKNAAQYNYSSRSEEYVLSKLNLSFPPIYSREKGINNYFFIVGEWYRCRAAFLKKFLKDNIVSQKFKEYYNDEMKYEYVRLIYAPLGFGYMSAKDLPVNYFIRSTEFLTGSFNLSHISSNINVALSFKYIFYPSDSVWNSFDSKYKFINQKFKGIVKSYLLTNLIGIYAKKQLPAYHNSLLNVINDAKNSIKDTICLRYIKQCELDYLLLNQPFPKDVLDNSYFKLFDSSKIISLANLLETYRDQSLYIDFWATWCEACRDDIAHSNDARRYLQSKKVAYIYISIDKSADTIKWRNIAVHDSIAQNQYLLINGIKSPLAVFLKLNFIPRYLLLSTDHKLKNNDATRPTISHLSNLKVSLSAALNQVIKFN